MNRPNLGDWGSRVQISALRPKNINNSGSCDNTGDHRNCRNNEQTKDKTAE
jgi:hypothetical protein